MAIMTLVSNNPDFSHVIAKNPATQIANKGPFKRTLRKGQVFGWFNDDTNQKFTLWFKDNPNEMSYSDSEFEYLDVSRYVHPYAYIGMVTEMLATASKGSVYDLEVGEDGTKYEYRVSINVDIPGKQIQSYFDAANSEHILIGSISWPSVEEVTVKASTMKKALALIQLICLAAALAKDDIYIPMKEEGVEKYLNMLNSAGATYKMRRLIINRMISNPNMLEKLRSQGLIDVVGENGSGMRFEFGQNEVQRLNTIKSLLGLKRGQSHKSSTLVDIGSGEIHNSLKLCEHYEMVVAYDKDKEVMDIARGKVKKRGLEEKFVLQETEVNKQTFETDEPFFDEADVLLTEVLEHMPKDEAKNLLELVLDTPANNVIVSVPCGEFNQFYGIEPGLARHHDHKWEPTRAEWVDFLASLSINWRDWDMKAGAENGHIDVVNGIPCTMFVHFSRVETTGTKQ